MPPPSPRICQRRPQRYHCRIRRIHVMSRLFSEADALRARSQRSSTRSRNTASFMIVRPRPTCGSKHKRDRRGHRAGHIVCYRSDCRAGRNGVPRRWNAKKTAWIGRSTDAGDAVVQAFSPRVRRDVFFVAPGTLCHGECPKCPVRCVMGSVQCVKASVRHDGRKLRAQGQSKALSAPGRGCRFIPGVSLGSTLARYQGYPATNVRVVSHSLC